MTSSEILKQFPRSILIALVNPYKKSIGFVREDEHGKHYIDPPEDFRSVWMQFCEYKPIYRRKMGRA